MPFRCRCPATRPTVYHLAHTPSYKPDPDYYSRYGFRITPSGPLTDATPVDLNLRFNGYDAHVTAYYWTAATLEKALVEAGFTDVTWHAYHAAETEDVDLAFVKPYLDRPHAIIIEAIKAPSRHNSQPRSIPNEMSDFSSKVFTSFS